MPLPSAGSASPSLPAPPRHSAFAAIGTTASPAFTIRTAATISSAPSPARASLCPSCAQKRTLLLGGRTSATICFSTCLQRYMTSTSGPVPSAAAACRLSPSFATPPRSARLLKQPGRLSYAWPGRDGHRLQKDDHSDILRLGSKVDRSPSLALRIVTCPGIRRGSIARRESRP